VRVSPIQGVSTDSPGGALEVLHALSSMLLSRDAGGGDATSHRYVVAPTRSRVLVVTTGTHAGARSSYRCSSSGPLARGSPPELHRPRVSRRSCRWPVRRASVTLVARLLSDALVERRSGGDESRGHLTLSELEKREGGHEPRLTTPGHLMSPANGEECSSEHERPRPADRDPPRSASTRSLAAHASGASVTRPAKGEILAKDRGAFRSSHRTR